MEYIVGTVIMLVFCIITAAAIGFTFRYFEKKSNKS
jgi:hypothetical protein